MSGQRSERFAAAFIEFTEEFDVLKSVGVDVGTDEVDAEVDGMSNDENDNEQEPVSAAGSSSQLVDDGSDNARAKTQCKKSCVRKDVSEIAGSCVVQTVQTAAEAAEDLSDGTLLFDPDDGRADDDSDGADDQQDVKHRCCGVDHIIDRLRGYNIL